MLLKLSELTAFLINAKRNSYAGQAERAPSKCILSKNYLYIEADYRYEDQYFGEYVDVGKEIVWFKEIPMWGMGYRGGMIDRYRLDVDMRGETFQVLRTALKEPPLDFPVRGPMEYQKGSFRYANEFTGDLTEFIGYEQITYNDRLVYKRHYLGGLIYGKKNPEILVER